MRPRSDETIELDLLCSARPDSVPEDSTIERNREALQRLMRHESGSTLPWPRPIVRRVATVAAAVTVLVGAAILATGSSDVDRSGDGQADVELAASHAFYGAPRCGEEPPPDLTIPEGFAGPIAGPGPDSVTQAEPDQLVRHWTSGSNIIELRWYADPDAVPPPPSDDGGVPADIAAHVREVRLTAETLPSGREQIGIIFPTDPGEPVDACTWVQITMVADNEADVGATFNAVSEGIVFEEP